MGLSPETIQNRIDAQLESDRHTSIHRSNWASLLGEKCDRCRYLWRTVPEQAEPIGIEGMRAVNNGIDEEKACKNFLSSIGFTVYTDRPESKGRWPKYNIAAHADFWLSENGSEPIIAEHKAPSSEWTWKKIENANDLKFSASQWIQKWYFQCQVTMLVHNQDRMLFFLKRPGKKQWKIFWIPLDLEDSEIATARAELDENNVQSNHLPIFLMGDPEHCQRCSFFGRACNPPLNFKAASYEYTPEMTEKLVRLQELKPLAAEYNKLDEEIKKPFKTDDCIGSPIIIGDYEILVKKSERKAFTVAASTGYIVKIVPLTKEKKISEVDD